MAHVLISDYPDVYIRDQAFITSFTVLYYFDHVGLLPLQWCPYPHPRSDGASSLLPPFLFPDLCLPLPSDPFILSFPFFSPPCCEAASLHVIAGRSGSTVISPVDLGRERMPTVVKMWITFSAALLL